MKESTDRAFIALFRDACQKCFGMPLTTALSETDSKLLSNDIWEKTGLVVGVKSIKNYSLYITDPAESKKENPSPATLDTLARYVLGAPATDEARRKVAEGHFPYWFKYRNQFVTGYEASPELQRVIPFRKIISWVAAIVTIVGAYLLAWPLFHHTNRYAPENFSVVSEDSLSRNGWSLRNRSEPWWNRSAEKQGHLTLFTLRGDNWNDSSSETGMRNLLVRKIDAGCFNAEVHLADFFPEHNWQQAGILLSEDSSFSDRMLRLSVSYNDFFGGYAMPPEIIVQGLSSSESGHHSKPEEIAHITLFKIESGKDSLVRQNLSHIVLKIEKRNGNFRLLYSTGAKESFAFKEAVSSPLSFTPRYLGLFAIQGNTVTENPMPVHFDSFRIVAIPCH